MAITVDLLPLEQPNSINQQDSSVVRATLPAITSMGQMQRCIDFWKLISSVSSGGQILFTSQESPFECEIKDPPTLMGRVLQAMLVIKNRLLPRQEIVSEQKVAQDPVQCLREAQQKTAEAVSLLIEDLKSSKDLPFISDGMGALRELDRILVDSARGLKNLAKIYESDTQTCGSISTLIKELVNENGLLWQLRESRIATHAYLCAAVDSKDLITYGNFAEAINGNWLLMRNEKESGVELLARANPCDYIDTSNTTLREIMQESGKNLKPAVILGSQGEVSIPDQVYRDLNRLATIHLDGEKIYDNIAMKGTSSETIYSQISKEFGATAARRIAPLLSQANLAQFTGEVTKMGTTEEQPVVAIGKAQHVAIYKNEDKNALCLAVTICFDVCDFDNIERKLSETEVTRHIVFPFDILSEGSEEQFQKFLESIQVADHYFKR